MMIATTLDATVTVTSWQQADQPLQMLRRRVFIEEQQVPEPLEWDGSDADAVHLLARDHAGNAIACARLLQDCHLGRMAVLPEHRGKGVGMFILQAAIAFARNAKWPHIRISAQTHAMGFYRKAGFIATGTRYMDAGIPHVDMTLSLDADH